MAGLGVSRKYKAVRWPALCIMSGFEHCQCVRNAEGIQSTRTRKPPIVGLDSAAAFLRSQKDRCAEIGLLLSEKAEDRLISKLTQKAQPWSEFEASIAEIHQRIKDEMEDKLFMLMPSDRAPFFDQPELLGKDVAAKFPKTQYDIVEAGNCYAAGRSTAAVFHLMRIMEVGVQQFGDKLGVKLTGEKNWQNILDEINKAMKARNPKDPATVEMSQAAANLYAVKLAWRNEVMHPKDTYTSEEAENLIGQVKLFMGQLAKIV